jgi:hypothetical protein
MVEQVLAKDQIRVRFPVAAQSKTTSDIHKFCPLYTGLSLYLIMILYRHVDNYVGNVYKGQFLMSH